MPTQTIITVIITLWKIAYASHECRFSLNSNICNYNWMYIYNVTKVYQSVVLKYESTDILTYDTKKIKFIW